MQPCTPGHADSCCSGWTVRSEPPSASDDPNTYARRSAVCAVTHMCLNTVNTKDLPYLHRLPPPLGLHPRLRVPQPSSDHHQTQATRVSSHLESLGRGWLPQPQKLRGSRCGRTAARGSCPGRLPQSPAAACTGSPWGCAPAGTKIWITEGKIHQAQNYLLVAPGAALLQPQDASWKT